MKKSKNWFSLVEIIIAWTILTVWVFWIYKLFWVNMSLLSNNETYTQAVNLEFPFKECLKNLWFSNFNTYSSGNYFIINFWSGNLECNTWSYNNNYTFSWVSISDNSYYLYWKISEKYNDKIKMDLNIYNSTIWNLYSENSNNKYIYLYK